MNADEPVGAVKDERMDRLTEAFKLALGDLYEANTAVQICNGFTAKHEELASESLERQQIWGFIEQGVIWKLLLAVERLTQKGANDRASLRGVFREIDSARESGVSFPDEDSIAKAFGDLKDALDTDICKKISNARNSFVGHSLIGEDREGHPVYDLIDFMGRLEAIAEVLHNGVFGTRPDIDTHIENWRVCASLWFDHFLPGP